MEQGIYGAIPISFRFAEGHWGSDQEKNKAKFQKYAADDFFDFYNECRVAARKGGIETIYTIKPEILLPNFKSFFLEFNGLIRDDRALEEENIADKFNADYDKAVASGDMDAFLKHFDDDTEDVPLCCSGLETVYTDIVGGCLLVYKGSRDVFLEFWSTLTDMELLLRAAMPHPLAKVMRFGLSAEADSNELRYP